MKVKEESVVRVLLVDHMPEVLKVLELMFGSLPNVEVVDTVRNNDEAMEVLKHKPVDVIAIDIYMGTYSGFDLCRTVRRTMPHVFIAMCSSAGSPENRRIAESLGGHYFLAKPISLNDIQELINAYRCWRENQHSGCSTTQEHDCRQSVITGYGPWPKP